MNNNEKLAVIISQCMCAYIETQSMIAENQHRMNCGHNIAYGAG